jgi:hypothetical protein
MVGRSFCKLFVEGGGYHNQALEAECRQAFSKLLEKAGFCGRMPRGARRVLRRRLPRQGVARPDERSFELPAMIDPQRLRRASPWADRFFNELDEMMG